MVNLQLSNVQMVTHAHDLHPAVEIETLSPQGWSLLSIGGHMKRMGHIRHYCGVIKPSSLKNSLKTLETLTVMTENTRPSKEYTRRRQGGATSLFVLCHAARRMDLLNTVFRFAYAQESDRQLRVEIGHNYLRPPQLSRQTTKSVLNVM